MLSAIIVLAFLIFLTPPLLVRTPYSRTLLGGGLVEEYSRIFYKAFFIIGRIVAFYSQDIQLLYILQAIILSENLYPSRGFFFYNTLQTFGATGLVLCVRYQRFNLITTLFQVFYYL